jgi:hypothetical protein
LESEAASQDEIDRILHDTPAKIDFEADEVAAEA